MHSLTSRFNRHAKFVILATLWTTILFPFHGYAETQSQATSARRCKAEKLSPAEWLLIENQLNAFRQHGENKQTIQDASLSIPVYLHVIIAGRTPAEGNVDDSVLLEQLAILNKAFESAKITFTLAEIDRTYNPKWRNLDLGFSVYRANEMQETLRKGGSGALNVYITTLNSTEIIASTQRPTQYELDPKLDGIIINVNVLPGGSVKSANLGMTLVHETGHWFGLYHTFFGGGCDTDGDSVSDTPAELSATFNCPSVTPDSCPNNPGVDSIHNYMNYTDDICRTEFTAGQIERMHTSFKAYRTAE